MEEVPPKKAKITELQLKRVRVEDDTVKKLEYCAKKQGVTESELLNGIIDALYNEITKRR